MNNLFRIQEKIFVIDRFPLFAGLSPEDKDFIARSGELVEYKKDAIIYKEGDDPDALYCVITGRLKVYLKRGAKDEELESLVRGKYFGIISLLTKEPHSVSIKVINDAILLKIPRDDFETILKRIPRLAIQFGQMLSRRLKRKDMHEKRIFESMIIAAFGTSENSGVTSYAVNLAVSLSIQTSKKVILVEVGAPNRDTSVLGLSREDLKSVPIDSPFFDEAMVSRQIVRDYFGIDTLSVIHESEKPAHVIPLITYLVNDYHYVILDLPNYIDKTIFESLKQSDAVHIVVPSDEKNLALAARLIEELEKSSQDMNENIEVITTEYGVDQPLDFVKKTAMLKHDIFATLPEMIKSGYRTDLKAGPIVVRCEDCGYSKTIRRISRQIGNCLIGLALGGGAALGLAHIGVLKVIEKENIPIDIVVGTSMGALIGAFWASGKNADEIKDMVMNFRTKARTWGLMDLTFPAKGFIKGRHIKKFLSSQLKDKSFYNLRMPFKAVACDIERREEFVIERGSLVNAIMASISIPGIFESVHIEGRNLVDGGVIDPLPTDVLMKMGVSKIIAVNTLPSPADIQTSQKKVTNILDIIVNSAQAGEYLLAEQSCQNVDLVLHPIFPTVDWYEFYESEKLIRRGEEETLKHLAQLKELATVPQRS